MFWVSAGGEASYLYFLSCNVLPGTYKMEEWCTYAAALFYAGQGGMTMSIWRALSPGAVIPHCAHNPVAAVAYAAHNPAPPPVAARAASIDLGS